MMKFAKLFSLMESVAMLVLPVASMGGVQAQALPFDGVSATVLTFVGPQVAEPQQRRAPDFKKLTRADITIATVPNADLYNSTFNDIATGTNAYHGSVIDPQYVGEVADTG